MLHRRLAAVVLAAVAVFGQLTSAKAMLLDDDMSRPASGTSRIRLIQALPGDQAVDLAARGGVLFADAKSPSASDDLEVQAARVQPEVRKAGGVATAAGGTAGGGRRFAVLFLLGVGVVGLVGFVVSQRSSG